MTINERLFALLKERGQGQNDLAAALGISQRTVSAWKNRGSDPPSNLISAISVFFGVSLEWLLTGDELPKGFQMTGSVFGSTIVGSNHGSLIVRNGQRHMLSDEASELLRIYESLDLKRRLKLLDLAINLEEETNRD